MMGMRVTFGIRDKLLIPTFKIFDAGSMHLVKAMANLMSRGSNLAILVSLMRTTGLSGQLMTGNGYRTIRK